MMHETSYSISHICINREYQKEYEVYMSKIKKFDCYDGLSLCGGLVFHAPVALLVRTQAGLSVSQFFLPQALLSAAAFLGEIPCGSATDRAGYQRTLVLAQLAMLAARVLLLAGFLLRHVWLFALEALVEALGFCLSSGTAEAYLYEVWGEEDYLAKTARSANFGTAGFLFSTLAYALLYRLSGIPGLLVGTVCATAAGLGFSLGLPPESRRRASAPSAPKLSQMVRLLGRGRHFVILGAVFSLAGLLVNFFYAEQLLACGVDAVWMSPIILGYSLTEMLAKVILDLLRKAPKGRVVGIFSALAALVMAALGMTHRPVPAISLMILLPLLLAIPSYCLSYLENAFISRQGQGENRAAALSMLSMGTDLIEILALFASAALTAAGPELCFPAVGLCLLIVGGWFAVKS